MDVSALIAAATEFFSSIPWNNVIQSFLTSVQGINWESLGSLFDWIDFSDGPLQTVIDAIVNFFSSIFGA